MDKNKLNLRVLDVEEMTEQEMASVTGGRWDGVAMAGWALLDTVGGFRLTSIIGDTWRSIGDSVWETLSNPPGPYSEEEIEEMMSQTVF